MNRIRTSNGSAMVIDFATKGDDIWPFLYSKPSDIVSIMVWVYDQRNLVAVSSIFL